MIEQPMPFEYARLSSLDLLTEVQETLMAAEDHGVVQRQAKQDALRLVSAAKSELQKAEPLAANYIAVA